MFTFSHWANKLRFLIERHSKLKSEIKNVPFLCKIILYLGTDRAWSSWTRISGGSRKDFRLEASLTKVGADYLPINYLNIRIFTVNVHCRQARQT
jgi:hypothetical protein